VRGHAAPGSPIGMSDRTPQEQLTKYLTDVHSIEEQAIVQMRVAPRLAHDAELARAFSAHLTETEEHERLVRAQLDQRGASPSTVKDVAGRAGGWGMVLFARMNPDTPGKLAAHGFSYEHMELAAYELLRRIAERSGEPGVAEMAARIGGEERAMADRLGAHWDAAVDASLRDKGAEDIAKDVVKYLRDAHALEAQALQLLETGPSIAGFDALAEVFREHLEETREHQRLVDERLAALGGHPARFQASGLRVGAMNMGMFFKGQPDTPVKLAGFAYAFEGLEIAAYELLSRTARRAGDEETAAMAERILADERRAAEKVAGTWDAAADAALEAQGVA
jgi:ferritin-like metal-binding protein YciE